MRTTTRANSRSQRLSKAGHALELPSLVTDSAGQHTPSTVLALTRGDVRLAMPCNPPHGARVRISIPTPDGESYTTISGAVHWKQMQSAEHEVGVFLDRPLPESLTGHCSDLPRKFERYRCRINGRLDFGATRPDCPGTAVNYSLNGMAIQCSLPGVMDEVFQFCWLDNDSKKSVTGVALWQIEQNGGYLIGCQLQPGDGRKIAGLNDSAPPAS